MIIEEDIYLEHSKETTDQEVEDFLEHFGVKGMRWGLRREANKSNVARLQNKGLTKRQAKNTNRYQNRVDAQRMTAKRMAGKANALQQLNNHMISNTMLSPSTALRHPLSSKKAAVLQLKKNQAVQTKIKKGESKVNSFFLKAQGISIKDIDYKT